LPRSEWNPGTETWEDAPFNVPELPEVYPEPSNWGILPAYGLYARHVENLYLHNLEMNYIVEDTRYPIVLDDVMNGFVKDIHAQHTENVEEVVCVQNSFKRPAGLEYVPDYPYHGTSVENVEFDSNLSIHSAKIGSPAPGTPKDSLYAYETVAVPENGYAFACATKDYPLPQTVFRPFFVPVPAQCIKAGETLAFDIIARQPAYEISEGDTDGRVYNETLSVKDFTVRGIPSPMTLKTRKLPQKAAFDTSSFTPGQACAFTWTPAADDVCEEPYTVTFIADDGVIPVEMDVKIQVKD
jgi:hypothetical protein